MKHTKGKWWIDENRCIASGKEDNYKTIAEVLDLPDREWRANANLMVLAPEMIEVLKGLKPIMDKILYKHREYSYIDGIDFSYLGDNLDKCLAKAEGAI